MKIQPVEQSRRMRVANEVLGIIADQTWLTFSGGYATVNWRQSNGDLFARRWITRGGQSFYPIWSNKWGHGGTCCTALSQLVRWVQGKPVLPMSTWRYWTGERVALGRERGVEIVQLLTDGGYPEHVKCVLCEREIQGGLDWWHLGDVSGPCCSCHSGCRQVRSISEVAHA